MKDLLARFKVLVVVATMVVTMWAAVRARSITAMGNRRYWPALGAEAAASTADDTRQDQPQEPIANAGQ